MARVTVEDCIEKMPNRFELVMLAAQRSRDIAAGSRAEVPRDGDKNPVIALREIAESDIDRDQLWEELANHFNPQDAVPEEPVPLTQEDVRRTLALAGRPEGMTGGEETAEGEGEAWSEEDMLRALQEMEGDPSS